ncbi:hypothetical protein [Deinococcus soli (ex Cha et al. 2016)]|uniref:Uncharacterized protein n=2 Tax=Deinococcus soli (ex Cha et al. 2016) TaxID=1309411 RepID=A0ACC6KFM8_9DEIO|nr:hypothetical protein [Deinococcus soli (ex Cha et al. 2016)]MDR6218335.1 hypothetical protein [Deinococcus soli (ex Cha et al. 2016)]MDR6329075.1 hypothetical protein [Deinococcus soli (ex Cha et al. 2016)]MDR6751348.1 hypothetical protein [Deinococcus soli (ex Cha et al. 2016)]
MIVLAWYSILLAVMAAVQLFSALRGLHLGGANTTRPRQLAWQETVEVLLAVPAVILPLGIAAPLMYTALSGAAFLGLGAVVALRRTHPTTSQELVLRAALTLLTCAGGLIAFYLP